MTIRVYLPVTATGLAALVDQRSIAGPVDAHAVTDQLREAWPDGDDEQWEYAALAAAADDSWVARTPTDGPRRHVVAADVADVEEVDGADGSPTSVRVPHDVLWGQVDAVHVDTEDLAGDPDLDDAPELAWFARQEIPHVVRGDI